MSRSHPGQAGDAGNAGAVPHIQSRPLRAAIAAAVDSVRIGFGPDFHARPAAGSRIDNQQAAVAQAIRDVAFCGRAGHIDLAVPDAPAPEHQMASAVVGKKVKLGLVGVVVLLQHGRINVLWRGVRLADNILPQLRYSRITAS